MMEKIKEAIMNKIDYLKKYDNFSEFISNTIFGLEVIALGTFIGSVCMEEILSKRNLNKKIDTLLKNPQTISGKPISVASVASCYMKDGASDLSVVIENSENGQKNIAEIMDSPLYCFSNEKNNLAAIIGSEINDGDNEKIKVFGKYDGSHFHFFGVEVEGNKYNCLRRRSK